MTPFRIGTKYIEEGRDPFIIAEAGVNHNGRLDLALKLVDIAASAGADAVKFQTFKAHEVVISSGEMAEYQKKNIGKTESQQAMLKKLELKDEFYRPIMERCKKQKILFMSTPHGGIDSVAFLAKLGIAAFKFGSGDLTNLPALQYAARLKKPMIISSGMATMPEIQEAIRVIEKAGNKHIVVLHCTTNYPCPPEEVNLRAMQTMMKKLNVPVGYSDHTSDEQASVAAVTLGASVIEKHFTIDANLPGPDHKASMEPQELTAMIRHIRTAAALLGSPVKQPNASEKRMMKMVRKSVVTLTGIRKGERFTAKNLGIKRPGTGLAPKKYFSILGKRASRALAADRTLRRDDIHAHA